MPKRKTDGIASIAVRFAMARQRQKRKLRKLLMQPSTAVMLFLGMSLSVGGVSEAFHGVQISIEKNLDQVRVVRTSGEGERVLATVHDSFAGNSLFKLARIFPGRYVTQRTRFFDSALLEKGDYEETIHRELSLINDNIREQFFSAEVPFGELIHEKATKYDVNPALVAAVIEQESSFRTRAQSHRGARGLMQLMPKTGRWMGARDLYDPDQNVDAGVKYLKYLQKRFDGDLKKTIAAYNAGEGTVMRYGGVPPYQETRRYVTKVMKTFERRKREMKKFAENAPGSADATAPGGTMNLKTAR